MAKLDIKDAAFHYLRGAGHSTDMYGIYVFDSERGDAPSFDAIRDHVAARRPLIPALNIVLKEVPLSVDFPSWVPGGGVVDEHMTDYDLTGASWSDVQQRISAFLEAGLDARERAWHIHVLRGAVDVPTVDGAATVVVLQVSHAMTDGMGLTRISSALFAPLGTPPEALGTPLPGHTPARRPKLPILAASAAVLAIPFRLGLYGVRIRKTKKQYKARRSQLGSPIRAGVPTRLTADPTSRRAVHIVPLPAATLRGKGVPVTAVALTAVAITTEKYLREHGDDVPDVLNSLVPVALSPEIEWSSANRALGGIVDLFPGEQDSAKRSLKIAESLVSERRRVTSPELLGMARAEEVLPAPVTLAVQRMRRRRKPAVPAPVWSHTNVVSVDRGRARPNIELCGSRLTFGSGTAMLTNNRSVVHGFFGVGDVITVVVLACPDTVPDHDRYVELLLESIHEM